MTPKLYLVSRADLSPAQQAVQAAHALQAFNIEHPGPTRWWYNESNTLAFLVVPNEEALWGLLNRANEMTYYCAPFHEPDRGNELTAVAFGPECGKLLSKLPLALRCEAA